MAGSGATVTVTGIAPASDTVTFPVEPLVTLGVTVRSELITHWSPNTKAPGPAPLNVICSGRPGNVTAPGPVGSDDAGGLHPWPLTRYWKAALPTASAPGAPVVTMASVSAPALGTVPTATMRGSCGLTAMLATRFTAPVGAGSGAPTAPGFGGMGMPRMWKPAGGTFGAAAALRETRSWPHRVPSQASTGCAGITGPKAMALTSALRGTLTSVPADSALMGAGNPAPGGAAGAAAHAPAGGGGNQLARSKPPPAVCPASTCPIVVGSSASTGMNGKPV